MAKKLILVCIFLVLLVTLDMSEARKKKARKHKYEKTKQIYDTRETNTPNFVRLVLMRLIYGIAAQMGMLIFRYSKPKNLVKRYGSTLFRAYCLLSFVRLFKCFFE